jgi:hypothetical protein
MALNRTDIAGAFAEGQPMTSNLACGAGGGESALRVVNVTKALRLIDSDVLHLHAGGHFIFKILFDCRPTIRRAHRSRESRVFRIHIGDGRGVSRIVGCHPFVSGFLDGLRIVSTGVCAATIPGMPSSTAMASAVNRFI